MTPATNLTHDGIEQSITEWALDYGITPGIIIGRIERGVCITDAITLQMTVGHRGQRLPIFSNEQTAKPYRARRSYRPRINARTYTYQGKTLSVREWSQVTGLTPTAISTRIRKGWSIEQALTTPIKSGVSYHFPPSKGTGGGSTLQENPNITFSGEVENA